MGVFTDHEPVYLASFSSIVFWRLSHVDFDTRESTRVGDTRRKLLVRIMKRRRQEGTREGDRDVGREKGRNDSPFSRMDPFATITFHGMKVENAVGVFQAREEKRARDNTRFVINRVRMRIIFIFMYWFVCVFPLWCNVEILYSFLVIR